jgi:hypothetical protein
MKPKTQIPERFILEDVKVFIIANKPLEVIGSIEMLPSSGFFAAIAGRNNEIILS